MCEHHDSANNGPVARSLDGMHRRDIVRALWGGSMLLAAPGLAGCADVASVFAPSDDELMTLSAQAWDETKKQTPISKDAKANARLQSVGPKIAKAANRPNDAWEFVVFDSQEKNAWVLPGGKVGFYKGLMDFCDNDDMVAAVLGHEVGHVVARHAALRAGQQTATNLAIQGGGALLGSQVKLSSEQLNLAMAAAGAGAQVGIFLPFSRDNELEADKLGVDYMHTAGYDVKQSIKLWEKMGAASAGARQSEWMSTHPNPETRVQQLKDFINMRGYAKV
jgi:predicted Zn-dependent protease